MKKPMSPDSAFAAGPLQGHKILVVDDEEDIRDFFLTVLADAGAQICEAESGDEAIRVAREHRPDLITLDLSMPGHEGIEAYCALREDPDSREIPVCVITGHPEMRALIYDRPTSPPEGFLPKPVSPEALVSTIRRILGLAQRKRERQGRKTEAAE